MMFNLSICLSLVGAKFPASSGEDHEVKAYREIEKQNMHKILDDYLCICQRMGVTILVFLSMYV